jgi:hypothetical protein
MTIASIWNFVNSIQLVAVGGRDASGGPVKEHPHFV